MKNIVLAFATLAVISCERDANKPRMSSDAQRIIDGQHYVVSGKSIDQNIEKEVIDYFKTTYGESIDIKTDVAYLEKPTSVETKKIIYKQVSNSDPKTGEYTADINSHLIVIPLPNNAIGGWVTSVDSEGYSNYTDQKLGYFTIFSNVDGKKVLIANTYTMKLKADALGNPMDFMTPSDKPYKVFVFKYITK